VGTFVPVFLIFSLTEGCNVGRPDEAWRLCLLALPSPSLSVSWPFTQAGLKPARDLAPCVFAWLAGRRQADIPDARYGFLTVYVLGSLKGETLASFFSPLAFNP
jgi:glycerol uptake facilitator protein